MLRWSCINILMNRDQTAVFPEDGPQSCPIDNTEGFWWIDKDLVNNYTMFGAFPLELTNKEKPCPLHYNSI